MPGTCPSLAGALTAVMAMDQLSFRVPKNARKPFGTAGSPAQIVFATGSGLEVYYTNDWGLFYLRDAKGPSHLTELLQTEPYSDRERARSQNQTRATKQG